jgi:excisionase family DNA binding protein
MFCDGLYLDYEKEAYMSLMSVNEVSKYIGVHKTTLYRLIKCNGLPFVTVGSRKKFQKEMVDNWVNSGEASK